MNNKITFGILTIFSIIMTIIFTIFLIPLLFVGLLKLAWYVANDIPHTRLIVCSHPKREKK